SGNIARCSKKPPRSLQDCSGRSCEESLTAAPTSVTDPKAPREPRGKLFLRFLRFGFLAWGGPVAQIAMIRRELVEEERWVSSERFNRTLAVYQVLPGPEAHE